MNQTIKIVEETLSHNKDKCLLRISIKDDEYYVLINTLQENSKAIYDQLLSGKRALG